MATMAERALCAHLWGEFVKCPTTGRVLEVLRGDDKALCGCGRSNPAHPGERTERTHTHVVRFCEAATGDEYLAQRDRDRAQEG